MNLYTSSSSNGARPGPRIVYYHLLWWLRRPVEMASFVWPPLLSGSKEMLYGVTPPPPEGLSVTGGPGVVWPFSAGPSA